MYPIKYIYPTLLALALCLGWGLPTYAQQAASTANKQGQEQIQKQTDKANAGIKGETDKLNEVLDQGTDKLNEQLNSLTEKFKAKTIKKNTALTRNYHNLTAYFNVYFNAYESYKEGVAKVDKEGEFDYTQVLPVFGYSASNSATASSAEMQRALEKSAKTIVKHSITSKPAIKKGKRMSKEEQEFYNQREFVKNIDEAYLLIAKANTYLHEYELAMLTLDFILVEFAKEPIVYKAKLWMAMLEGEQGNVIKQEEILLTLKNDKNFPAAEQAALSAALADLYIRKKEYSKAIPYMEISLKKAKGTNQKQRYHYILGQLYLKEGNTTKAADNFTAVIRKFPPYEMEFNAKLTRASASKKSNMRKLLMDMATDEKNKEYLDRIYYSLGELERAAGNTAQAAQYYSLSAANCASAENPQKMQSYYAAAQAYEEVSNFEQAQLYYDSTRVTMPKNNPHYYMVVNKADNLNMLAGNIRIIKTEDSLQHIAKMSSPQRAKYVRDQISKAKGERMRQERMAAQLEAQQQLGSTTTVIPTNTTTTVATGKWYFYNPTVVKAGKSEFKRIWGQLALADNWRQGSTTTMMDISDGQNNNSMLADAEQTGTQEDPTVPPNETEEYYLENVPLTPAALDSSNRRMAQAMLDAGKAYKDYIKDNAAAIAMLQELLRRVPSTDLRMTAYFQLYSLYSLEGNPTQANTYKTLLLTQYPDETVTQYLKDPNYKSAEDMLLQQANSDFEKAYLLYDKQRYAEAALQAQKGIEQYGTLSIAPYFELLKAMAESNNRNLGQYMSALTGVIERYPDTQPAKAAQDILDILKQDELRLAAELSGNGSSTSTSSTAPAVVPYTTSDGGAASCIIVIERAANANQLLFNLAAYNADLDLYVDFVTRTLGDNYTLVVSTEFDSLQEAAKYYNLLMQHSTNLFKDTEATQHSIFYITKENLELLNRNKSVSIYLDFFNRNLLGK